ncbi:unnamed protein product [Mytilus coruscus]|uniref:Uncharacterized protein n=1 Tax=Mytilus coruscus TaxID=42192 RepID=A0A6J8BN91_MYTCO|nr:unnamed protein product [Mytilus coruscus]
MLTFTLVSLVDLTTAARAQSLSALDLHDMSFSQRQGIIGFHIHELLKTTRPGTDEQHAGDTSHHLRDISIFDFNVDEHDNLWERITDGITRAWSFEENHDERILMTEYLSLNGGDYISKYVANIDGLTSIELFAGCSLNEADGQKNKMDESVCPCDIKDSKAPMDIAENLLKGLCFSKIGMITCCQRCRTQKGDEIVSETDKTFLTAVLLNQKEHAATLWTHFENPMMTALVSSMYLTALANIQEQNFEENLQDEYNSHAKESPLHFGHQFNVEEFISHSSNQKDASKRFYSYTKAAANDAHLDTKSENITAKGSSSKKQKLTNTISVYSITMSGWFSFIKVCKVFSTEK